MPNKLVLTTQDLPDITNWKNGETYTVTLELKQVRGGADRKSFEIVSAQSEEAEPGGQPSPNAPAKPAQNPQPSSGDGQQEPQEIMANNGSNPSNTPMRSKMIDRMKQKVNTY